MTAKQGFLYVVFSCSVNATQEQCRNYNISICFVSLHWDGLRMCFLGRIVDLVAAVIKWSSKRFNRDCPSINHLGNWPKRSKSFLRIVRSVAEHIWDTKFWVSIWISSSKELRAIPLNWILLNCVDLF